MAPLVALVLTTRLHAAAGDTVADRVLGQVDFVHRTDPSFIRKKSLDLQGDPRGNAVAIDKLQSPSPIYVADTRSNRVLAWSDVSSFIDGADADLVIGAPDFFTGSQGCLRTSTGFCGPQALAVDPSGNLFVSGDHVEKFASPFGQSPPVSGTTFVDVGTGLDPWGVTADSHGNVYVAMRNQNEVVEYDAGSTTPHLVFGQSTSSGGPPNRGGSPSATTLSAPYAVAVDALDNLYVADTANNRVLVYNTPLDASSGETGAGDTTADRVIGQSLFTTGGNGTTSTALSAPHGLAVDLHGHLYVADTSNHRVTEYDASIGSGEAATLVIGQPDATSNGCNQNGAVGAGTLCNPTGAATDPSGNLYVYDANNDRIVAYPESNPPRTKIGTRVLGQHDLTHATENFVDATTVNATAVAIDRGSSPNHLYVVDAFNNRVLGYNDAATFANGGAADLVLGQPDVFSNAPNGGLPCCGTTSANVLLLNSFGHEGAAVDSHGNLWVSDPGNRRAVGYAAPFNSGMAENQPATKVLGEPDLTTAAGGIGCAATQTSTCAPEGLALDTADNLYLVDSENGRVLEFATPWTFAGAPPEPASLVFGQGSTGTNFAGGGCNQGGESADSLCGPFGVALDAHGNLYVADSTNNRVLEYDKPLPFGGGNPGTPGSAGDVTADLVFGQGGAFNASTCNNGGGSATSLCTPLGLSLDPFGSLFVSDSANNRVLGYGESANPPTNVTATLEFGQGMDGNDFTHNGANAGGLSASSLSINQFNRFPGLATDSAGNLYVADTGNARLLEYDGGFLGAPVPTTTSTSTTSTTSTSTTTTISTSTTTSSTTTTPPSTTTTSTTSTTTTRPSTTTTTTTSTTATTVTPPTTTTTLMELCAATCANPRLGAAAGCTILELSGAKVDLSGSSLVDGDVCLGSGGQLVMSGRAHVTGELRYTSPLHFRRSGGASVAGGPVAADLSQPIADARNAAAAAAGLGCTQTLPSLKSTQTIVGNGGLNVVCVGDVVLSGKKAVTLQGGPSDAFVLKVSGRFSLSGQSEIRVAGDVQAGGVLYDIIGSARGRGRRHGGAVMLSGKTHVDGTLLAPDRKVAIEPGSVTGQIVSGHAIVLSGGAGVRCRCSTPLT